MQDALARLYCLQCIQAAAIKSGGIRSSQVESGIFTGPLLGQRSSRPSNASVVQRSEQLPQESAPPIVCPHRTTATHHQEHLKNPLEIPQGTVDRPAPGSSCHRRNSSRQQQQQQGRNQVLMRTNSCTEHGGTHYSIVNDPTQKIPDLDLP
ncbi:unnamed protein product [Lampetra fluviatilis]